MKKREAIERLSSLLATEARSHASALGLKPVHLEILEYLGRCNRYSDTPAAVTEYLGSTKGTVSQSLQRLEEKKLLGKAADARDRRVVHLSLTPKGRRLVKDAPLSQASDFLADLADDESAVFERVVGNLLAHLQRANGRKAFGQCATCRLFETLGADGFRCGLTREPLTVADSELICREFEPGPPG